MSVVLKLFSSVRKRFRSHIYQRNNFRGDISNGRRVMAILKSNMAAILNVRDDMLNRQHIARCYACVIDHIRTARSAEFMRASGLNVLSQCSSCRLFVSCIHRPYTHEVDNDVSAAADGRSLTSFQCRQVTVEVAEHRCRSLSTVEGTQWRILPSPLLLFHLPFLPLEVGTRPLKSSKRSRERCKLPQRGLGRATAEIEFGLF